MIDNKKENTIKNESNDERDQDEGSMNNGTIGGDIGISDSSDEKGDAGVSGSEEGKSKTVSVDSKGTESGK